MQAIEHRRRKARFTDVLSQVERWSGFTSQFAHVSTGLPPADERTFLAALIAEATNVNGLGAKP